MEPLQLFNTLSELSPLGLFAMFIVALLKGWLVLPRELQDRDSNLAKKDKEIAELKTMLYKALNLGERMTFVAEEGEEESRKPGGREKYR